MKKLLLITLLGATVGSAWCAAAQDPYNSDPPQNSGYRYITGILANGLGGFVHPSFVEQMRVEVRKVKGFPSEKWFQAALESFDDEDFFDIERYEKFTAPKLKALGFPGYDSLSTVKRDWVTPQQIAKLKEEIRADRRNKKTQ